MVGKGLVAPRIIDAYSHNMSVELVELLHAVSEGTHFSGADAGEGAGEER